MSNIPLDPNNRQFEHGLAFIALLSFIVAFTSARIFTTMSPSSVVVTGGIHFHHFWYGLVMVVVAGWVGIVSTNRRRRPIIAVVFGFGGGLIGDEVGLLLTLGNYHTPLTYPIVVGVIALGALGILFFHSGKYLKQDFKGIASGDKIILLGTGIAALSFIAFPANQLLLGGIILTLGFGIVVVGYFSHYLLRR